MTQIHSYQETDMDEYLFLTAAKLKADRLRVAREQRAQEQSASSDTRQLDLGLEAATRIADEAELRPALRTTATTKIAGVAVSLLVNLSLVLAFVQTGHVPDGEVFISHADGSVTRLAQAPGEAA